MPTLDLGEPYSPTWRGRPAGMLDPDVPVWHRYLDTHAADYLRLYYNVRISTEDYALRFPDPNLLAIAAAILPKRVDAIGERPNGVDIIEVTETSGLRAIGQVLTYATLWKTLRPDDKRPIRLLIVCARCGVDESLAARAANIILTHA